MADLKKMSQTKTPKRRWRWWHIALVIMMALIVIGALVWKNRYSILENQTRQWLNYQGYQGELQIVSISGTKARLSNIRLSTDGELILKADSVDIEYELRAALKGQFQRLVVRRPELTIHLDEKGNIIDDWAQALSGKHPSGANTFVFPPRGIDVEDAKVNWSAPFGQGTALITANIQDPNTWNLDIHAPNTKLSHRETHVEIDGTVVLISEGPNGFSASGRVDADVISLPFADLQSVGNDFRFHVTRNSDGIINVDGFTVFQIENTRSADITIGKNEARFDIKSQYNPQTQSIGALHTQWSIEMQDLGLIDTNKRQNLAKTLSAQTMIAHTPIAQNFIADITTNIDGLLAKTDMTGQGLLTLSSAGYQIDLSAPLKIQSKAQSITLRSQKDNPFLNYDKATQDLTLRTHADWDNHRAIHFQNVNADMKSVNGLNLTNVKTVSATIKSMTNWRKSVAGIATRLAPVNLDITYMAGNDQTRLIMNGGLDYDGPIPGGHVNGLRANGQLHIYLKDGGFVMDFAPSRPVHIDAFKNASAWQVSDIIFDIPNGKSLLMARGDARLFSALIANASAVLTSSQDDRHMRLRGDKLHVKSDISQEPKIWDITYSDAQMRSDDFPLPGTNVHSPKGSATIIMSKDDDLHFDITSPTSHVKTDNLVIDALAFSANGKTTDFTFTYDTPKVEVALETTDIPTLPARGTGQFTNGAISGHAVSLIPKTKDMPIYADFRVIDGVGSAEVRIDQVFFSPSGLQPQDIVPALQGKLAAVSGGIEAAFNIRFDGKTPIQSSGKVSLIDLDVGTLAGPFTGIQSELSFSSMLPLKSDGVQFVKIGGFDPGFPLKQGAIAFEIVPGGVRIDQAIWPVLNPDAANDIGKIEILPTDWRFGGAENRLTTRIENISLGAITKAIGKKNIYATGKITGELPIIVKGVHVIVENGLMQIKDGGVIRYTSPSTQALIREGGATDQEAFENSNYPSLTFRALQDFRYNYLEARLNGPLEGEMALEIAFEGRNADVLGGQSFAFDLNLVGKLVSLAKNLASSAAYQQTLDDIIDNYKASYELSK